MDDPTRTYLVLLMSRCCFNRMKDGVEERCCRSVAHPGAHVMSPSGDIYSYGTREQAPMLTAYLEDQLAALGPDHDGPGKLKM